MIFVETPLRGSYLVDVQPISDERGFFARTWCQREFNAHGLDTRLAQCSVSFNEHAGTLRGLHYQTAPYEEVKLVRCTAGAIFDVIVDLRAESPTCGQYFSAILSPTNHRMLYIPRGFAHGYQTLENATEVAYQMSEFYHPDFARGVRWNDPAFDIAWPPADHRIINDRDRSFPDFRRTMSPRAELNDPR